MNIVGIVFTIIGVAMLIAGIIFLARFATGGAGSVSKGTDPKTIMGLMSIVIIIRIQA